MSPISAPFAADLDRARTVLREVFGYPDLRPGQDEIVAAVLAGEDVLAVMPTGAGKSMCYQLPALVREELVVVVSPLIALMRNQVAQMRANGVAAGALNSTTDTAEWRSIMDDLAAGRLRLLYLAPERLARPDTQEMLARAKVAMIAVDEAHCISQWGHDFRPEYRDIGAFAAALGNPRILALTATADEATRGEIVERLFARPPRVFVHGFDRPNLFLAMRPKAEARRQLLRFLDGHGGESGVVYCSSRRQTEELAEAFRAAGHHALAYHAGMDAAARSAAQDTFLREDGVVMVATVAFGMGIDKPDVRFVAHASLPKSIEAWYQEIGRAGRDGLPADTLTLYGTDDILLRRRQIDESEASDEQKRVERQRLNALVALAETPRCRRQVLLAFFGEESEPCGHCDVCRDGVETFDGTLAAQKALSAIIRTDQRFGEVHLVDVLVGDATERVVKFGHDKLKTFGVGKEFTKPQWRAIFRQMLALGLADVDMTGHGAWWVTEAGGEVLKGRREVVFRRDVVEAARSQGKKKSAKIDKKPSAAGLDEAGARLLAHLKSLRADLARELNAPAYVVFADRTLIEMAEKRPTGKTEMATVHGVGAAKLERFGDVFLRAIRDFEG
ncbi:MAG: DNA helicase RecQ [Phyllobacteriaceae bacterium]|nr:DNA helicase RecQ [Phyllobacteriaceae bacterium]